MSADAQAELQRAAVSGAGGRLVADDGKVLPLQAITLRADACGGLARITLEQIFRNPYAEPLEVTYLVSLPSGGTVSGYGFRVGDRRIVGEVDGSAAARERFEQAQMVGRSAALLEQERPNLFTQRIGNIAPGADVVAEIVIDQRLVWLPVGAWEWRFPTVVAPRFLGAEGRVPDAERVVVDVSAAELLARLSLRLVVRDRLVEGGWPTSLSHDIRATSGATGLAVTLANEDGVPPDRDVVVCWPTARATMGVSLDSGRPAAGTPHSNTAYGLLTIVPPTPETAPATAARDLIVLLDASGSMDGEPFRQACRVAADVIETLRDTDRLELIVFSDRPRRWKREAVTASGSARRQAREWLGTLRAGGGTEMREAVVEALRSLRPDAQRQVVLVTDGLVGFETEIVAAILADLPPASRLHTVGVGSAVNRGLTGPAARAGRGVEITIGLGEAPDAAIQRLIAHTRSPLLTHIELEGSALREHAPAQLPDVYAEAPLRIAVKLRPCGGELRVRGRTAAGVWEERVDVASVAAGAGSGAVVALYGCEAVEDIEMRRAAGEPAALDRQIERIGLEFQIATRLTSWIAVSEEPTVDPTLPWRRERMPHALPYGLSAEGLGLRPATHHAVSLMRVSEVVAPYPSASVVELGSMDLSATEGFPDQRQEYPARNMLRARLSKLLPGPPAAPAGADLAGSLVHREERALSFEITVEKVVDWQPEKAEVFWPDATHLGAEIDWKRTTRPGRVDPDQTIRLTVLLPEDGPADPPSRIVLDCGGARLGVTVRRA